MPDINPVTGRQTRLRFPGWIDNKFGLELYFL
ncbi:hypothetical protein PAECIP111892_02786 [Paenibacillus auburnensis]|uniref:Uncharacterized protein n=1 Tax=Paenibacillus auburnensis TaxID=2905649 RepID=A0ABM9C9K6_9BACL|nr:hypothetical protein PAECIP111892_02786 [Paenibacillus auburnensis]